jgi:peptide/nickel transport system substrate-binding protein
MLVKTHRILGIALILIAMLTLVVGIKAQDEVTIVIGWEQEPPLLSPRSDMAFAALMNQFFSRDVWNWDVNNQIFPVMVTDIPSPQNGLVSETAEGNTVVTYKLRPGMKWSDGEPITADDCLFVHQLYMDPGTLTFQRASYPEVVASVEKVDDLTVVMTYNTPFPDYLTNAYLSCGLPEHILGPELAEKGNLDDSAYWTGQNSVGYGPYVLSNWTVGDSMTFTKNPNWDGQQPAISTVILRFITDSAQMVNALEAGEIDLAFNFSDDLLPSYSAIDGVTVFSTDGVFGDAIWINVGNGGHVALRDVNVRKAIIEAIDRETLAHELVSPTANVPKSWYAAQYWPEDLPILTYNVDDANKLLTDAGWIDDDDNPATPRVSSGVEGVTDGFPLVLRFYTTTRQIRMDYQVAIQEYLNAVGVGTLLNPVPANLLFGDFLEGGILDTGGFDLSIFALSTNPLTPFADAPDWFGCDGVPTAEKPNGNNGWGWCDPEWDALDLQVGSTVDPVARLELAHQAVQHFYDGQFWHGLYLRQTHYALSNNFDVESAKGVGVLNSNYFDKIEYWLPAS